jgi:hypothetical protein
MSVAFEKGPSLQDVLDIQGEFLILISIPILYTVLHSFGSGNEF